MIVNNHNKGIIFFFILSFFTLIAGCASNGETVKGGKVEDYRTSKGMRDDLMNKAEERVKMGEHETPEELFRQGIALSQKAEEKSAFFRNERYMSALSFFQEIKEKYSYSEYAILSELKIADCYYDMKNYEEAIASYRDFRKLHPTNEYIPYVIYRTGLCYFNQILLFDQDQTVIYKAIKEFEYLINNYPYCEYVQECKDKTGICNKELSKRVFYIGEFYFKSKEYLAAWRRFEQILIDYPGLGLDDQAYRYIRECKTLLNEQEQIQEK